MTIERNVKGLLGTKLGMTQVWDDNNVVVPVTVVAATTNVVTQVRRPETDGYNAIQVGFGEIEARKVNKPTAGPLRQGRHDPAPPPASRSARPTPRPTRWARSSPSTRSPPVTSST